MRRALALVLALCLSGSSILAQSPQTAPVPRALSLRDSVRVEAEKFVAAQAGQPASEEYRPGGMSPGLFWTAMGLMIGGGGFLLSGAFIQDDELPCVEFEIDCSDARTAALVIGSGLVGSGLVVYVVGKNKGRAAPQIVTTPRGLVVRSRIGF